MPQHSFFSSKDNRIVSTDASTVAPYSGIFPKILGDPGVKIFGTYRGLRDDELEIEIIDDNSSAPSAGTVEFFGVGSGSLNNISTTPSVDSQTITVTLAKANSPATNAFYDLGNGIRIVARTAGPDGNGITIEIRRTGSLRLIESDWRLPNGLSHGSCEVASGIVLDVPFLTPTGEVPPSAPRVVLGRRTFPVYRLYNTVEDNTQKTKITPSAVHTYNKGESIYTVNWQYEVTITKGNIIERLPNIVTQYDFLSTIKNKSSLVTVEGIFADNRKPDGYGILDVFLITGNHVGELTTNIESLTTSKLSLQVLNELKSDIRARCIDASVLNGEVWRVEHGGVSTNIRSGDVYNDGNIYFVIPKLETNTETPPGYITLRNINYAPRSDTEKTPPICIEGRLGSYATHKSITFKYVVPKHDTGCDCSGMDPVSFDETCYVVPTQLRTILEGGDVVNIDQQKLLMQLAEWRKSAMQSATTSLPSVAADTLEVDIIEAATYFFQKAIIDVGDKIGPVIVWKPNTTYRVGELIWSADKEYYFECISGGTSGNTEPTWDTDTGDTTQDNTCLWLCRGESPYKVLENTLTIVSNEYNTLASVNLDSTSSSGGWIYTTPEITIDLTKTPLYVFGQGTPDVDEFVVEVPDVPEIFLVCRKVVSGTFYEWGNLEEIKRNIFESITGYIQTVFHVQSVNSIWSNGGSIFKGTKTADQITGHYGYYSSSITEDLTKELRHWFTRVKSYIQTAYAYAGMTIEVVNPFDEASSEEEENGSPGCWELPDLNEPYWEVNDGEYIPALTNKPYYSAKIIIDERGKRIVRTYEFAIAIKVKCPELLKDGDTVTIEIVPSATSVKGYAVNDQFEIKAITINPILLLGASAGDPFERWHVSGTKQSFEDYIVDISNPTPYSSGGLSFSISHGTVPFAPGDTFVFDLSRQRFRWKTSTSDWSSPQVIGTDVLLFDDIHASFYSSYTVGDRWKFLLPQPYSVDNVKRFDGTRWKGEQDGILTLYTSSGSYLALALFCKYLESSLDVVFYSGANTVWSMNLQITRGNNCYVVKAPSSFDKITIAVPFGVEIVTSYVGDGFSLDYDPEQVGINREYISESSRFAMKQFPVTRGYGATTLDITFPSVSYNKVNEFIKLIEYLHDNGDEPVIYSVNTNIPTDAVFCKIRDVRLEEWYRLQSQPENRDYTVTMQAQGVYI